MESGPEQTKSLFEASHRLSIIDQCDEVYDMLGHVFDYLGEHRVNGALAIIIKQQGKLIQMEAAYSELEKK